MSWMPAALPWLREAASAVSGGPPHDRELLSVPLFGTERFHTDQPQAAEHLLLARGHFGEVAVGNLQFTFTPLGAVLGDLAETVFLLDSRHPRKCLASRVRFQQCHALIKGT